jgi:hypothetical protein
MPSRIKPHISFYDKTFIENRTGDYYLSIQLGNQHLSFAVFNPEINKFIVLETFAFSDLKSDDQVSVIFDFAFESRHWLKGHFQKVLFLIDHQLCTLVPPTMFIEEMAKSYLQFNHPIDEAQHINYNVLKNANIIDVFGVPQLIHSMAKKFWPDLTFLHCSSVIIESLSINFKNKIDNNTLFLNVRDEGFDLIYFKKKKLHFYNLFKYNTKEDFMYFLLSAIEELQLNPEEVALVISGNIDKSHILYEMTYRYIRNVRFIERNDNYKYSYLFDGLHGHKQYTLFNALQCE